MHHVLSGLLARPLGLALIVLKLSGTLGLGAEPTPFTEYDRVGRLGANRFLAPTGQLLTPAGQQVELPGMRPQALALSPDGRLLAAAGKTNALVLIDPRTGQIRQTVYLPKKAEPKAATNAVAKATTNTVTNASTNTVAGVSTNAVASTSTNSVAGASTNAAAGASTNSVANASTNARATTNTAVKLVATKPAAAPQTRTNATSTLEMSLNGLIFSPNGKRLFLSTTEGHVNVFTVENTTVRYLATLLVPPARAPSQKKEVPAGLAVSRDGRRLYVAGNLGNKLYEMDSISGRVLRSWNTGVAPYDVVLAAGKVYVSNMGGRRPGKGDLKASAGRGTGVRVDPIRFVASEGSVTVIDLRSGKVTAEILVELHASAMTISPNGRYVVVANTGSDTLSVIDTRTDNVAEKIWTRQSPGDLFGAQPNALTFDARGRRLYVCNATQNAVAVIEFAPGERASRVLGLIPVGWFPGAVEFDAARNALYVANIKGIGATRMFKPGEPVKLTTKDWYGIVSLVPAPTAKALAEMTAIALRNMRQEKIEQAKLPPRPNQPARPVPERVGEPSVFKHVIYVIKENRSYDQVLGDMVEGNGNAKLCTFGERVTPNQHKIAREFVLLDNTYCSGVQSADGHQWTDSALANEYVERQLTAAYPRSYSSGKTEDGLDALSWASSGFIWDNALAHGKTFRNYGEWMLSLADWRDKKGHKDKPKWEDYYHDLTNGTSLTRLRSKPGIESLRRYSNTNTVGWDLSVPDGLRAVEFIKELRQFETNGNYPNLALLFLPNDHTGGTRGRAPTPGAQVADNDLAFGQIVEAVSRSKFWPETCLIAIEDDPQAGWDHVSGYRTTCYVVSPYTKRKQTVSTPYNQTSLVRTIELILGLPPMNQLDASADSMSDCFTSIRDLTPFTSVPNQIPLDQTNAEPKKISDPILRKDAIASAKLRLDEPDRCPEDVLNRILWHAMKGTAEPYPEWAVKTEDD